MIYIRAALNSCLMLIMFFEAFSFPNLRELSIAGNHWSPLILQRLWDRSQFNLQNLQLTLIDLHASDLIEFLGHLPALRELYLSWTCVQDELIVALTGNPGVPELEKLYMCHSTDECTGGPLADMFESLFQ